MDGTQKLRSLFPRGSEEFFKVNGGEDSSHRKSPSFGTQKPTLGAIKHDYTPLGEIVKISFRGDPASKQRPRVVDRRAFTPKETKQAEKALKLLLVLSYPKMEPDGEHCFEVSINFFCLRRQRKDLDNMTKLVLDACNGIVWVDDSQVTALNLRVSRGSDHPRTELSIIAIESDIPFIICPCGNKVRLYRSTEKTRRFCSRACSVKSQKSPSIACLGCGELFHPIEEQRFCSQACYGRSIKGKPRHMRKIRDLVEQYQKVNGLEEIHTQEKNL
jgi:Holliday junction resolvase RusA-like endonuclease